MPHNFALPNESYNQGIMKEEDPAQAARLWLSNLTEVGFSHFICHMDSPHCDNVEAAGYSLHEHTKQEENWRHRFLPDIDGNSYSGRFRSFLRSTSMPIKATIFDEWHDSRLIPWRHFVPMDNTFVDYYGILEYFAGHVPSATPAHDDAARAIAHQGAQWSRRTGRKADQLAYFYRLILELARIHDDRRLTMGWVDDLQPH